jgi:hypothetical protein
MSYEDLNDSDRRELESLRNLLFRAVKELDYIHAVDTTADFLITSSEGKEIVGAGMKLLGLADLSPDELPIRLVRA